MKKIFLSLLIIVTFFANAQTNPTAFNKIKVTGSVQDDTDTQIVTRDASSSLYGHTLKSSLVFQQLKSKKWVTFGDSFSDSLGSDGYQYYVAQNTGMTGMVTNAVTGNKIADQLTVLNTLISGNASYFLDYDICTLLVGVNDLTGATALGNRNSLNTDANYAGRLKKFIEVVLTSNPNIKLYILTPTEANGAGVTYKGAPSGWSLGDLSVLIAQICSDYAIQCIDLYSLSGFNLQTFSTLTSDSLHPNVAGNTVIGDIITNAFQGKNSQGNIAKPTSTILTDDGDTVTLSSVGANIALNRNASTNAFNGLSFKTAGTYEGGVKFNPTTGSLLLDAGRSVAWGGKISFMTDTVERFTITNALVSINLPFYTTNTLNFNNRFLFDTGGVVTWGNSGVNGKLSWDTTKAIVGGMAGNSLSLYADAVQKATIETNGNMTINATDNTVDKLQVGGSVLATSFKKSGDTDANILLAGGGVTSLTSKQDALVSATNIKTINGASVLGSGDLVVTGVGSGANLTYTASATNGLVNSDTGTDATIPLADGTNAGLLKPADFTTLANGVLGLTGNQTKSGTLAMTVPTSQGTGLSITNSDSGSVSTGISVTNESTTGYGLASTNNSTSAGSYFYNTSSGKNIVLNNSTAATGIPFSIQKNAVDKLTINDNGEIIGNKFTKTAGTATEYLMADGSTINVLPTSKVCLTANATANSTTTLTAVSGLTTTLVEGTYNFKYTIIYQSSATTTGVGFGVNYTGTSGTFVANHRYSATGTTASSGAATMAAVGATGNVYEAQGSITKNALIGAVTISVNAINSNMLSIVEGTIIVTTGGDLQLLHRSETANSTQVMAGSNLILERMN